MLISILTEVCATVKTTNGCGPPYQKFMVDNCKKTCELCGNYDYSVHGTPRPNISDIDLVHNTMLSALSIEGTKIFASCFFGAKCNR